MNLQNDSKVIDFIGVGAEKTGSSWLFRCLTEHPQICNSVGKETIFFDTTKIFGRPDRLQSDYEKYGIDFYKKKFTNCPNGSIKGEFTTTYLHDKSVAKNIYGNFPNVKIIICLRNPVEKSFAQYVAIQEWRQYRDFEDAIEKEPEFIRRSTYTEYVNEYFKYFPKENIFIIIYEEMIKNHLELIQRLYRFLGVRSDFVPSSINMKVDTEELKILTEYRNRIQKNSFVKNIFQLIRLTKLNILIKNVALQFIDKPKIKMDTRIKLQNIFEKDINNLEQLIGQDLSIWKK